MQRLSEIIRQDLDANDARVRRNAIEAAAFAQKSLRSALGTPYPPASRPGQVPHRRTGTLHRSAYARLVADRSGGEGQVAIEVGATATHAAPLSRTRPFVPLVMQQIRPEFEAILLRDL